MNKYYCSVSVSAILWDNSLEHRILSQIIYGETCEIIEKSNTLSKIKLDVDGTEGWVDSKILKPLNSNISTYYLQKPFDVVSTNNGNLLLSLGSELEGNVENILKPDEIRQQLTSIAQKFINVPYLKGGRTYFGTDSEGLVQILFKSVGIILPRFAKEQLELGTSRDFIMESQPGDVLFFSDLDGNNIDSGIVLSTNEVIHSSGKVRLDLYDSTGIYNPELNTHTHLFVAIKSYI